MMKRLVLLIVIMCSLLCYSYNMCFAESESEYNEYAQIKTIEQMNSDYTIMSDKFVWKIKVVNGVTYKRLYNETKKVWVGDWIRC